MTAQHAEAWRVRIDEEKKRVAAKEEPHSESESFEQIEDKDKEMVHIEDQKEPDAEMPDANGGAVPASSSEAVAPAVTIPPQDDWETEMRSWNYEQ